MEEVKKLVNQLMFFVLIVLLLLLSNIYFCLVTNANLTDKAISPNGCSVFVHKSKLFRIILYNEQNNLPGSNICSRNSVNNKLIVIQMEKNGTQIVKFKHFLEKFPTIELPITLNDEVHHEFSKNNDPLPAPMIDQFLAPLDEDEPDEFTEYIACFQIPKTQDFYAIVYWKAELLTYQYILVSYSPKGEVLDKKTIAGTFYDGKKLIQSVATIEEDWEIVVVSGQSETKATPYDPATSTVTRLELQSEGQIVETV